MRNIKKLLFIQFLILSYFAYAESGNETPPLNQMKNVEYLDVVGVKENDTLSLRQSENSQSEIVYKIPYNAHGGLRLDVSKGWVKLSYNGHIGWANSKYLKKGQPPSMKAEFSSELFCTGTEPHWLLSTEKNGLSFKKYDVSKLYILDAPVKKSLNETGIWWLSAVQLEKATVANSQISV